METKKMSLANIQGKLSRAEMKNIMAGSGSGGSGLCSAKDCFAIVQGVTKSAICTTNKDQSCSCPLGDHFCG